MECTHQQKQQLLHAASMQRMHSTVAYLKRFTYSRLLSKTLRGYWYRCMHSLDNLLDGLYDTTRYYESELRWLPDLKDCRRTKGDASQIDR
jgi:hypothetical protein